MSTMMLVPQKKFWGGGVSISVGVNVHQGGSAFLFCSSSVVSGFGILLLGGGVVSIGGSYDWIRVLGIRRFQLAVRPASGGRLHPGSSPGHLAVGFIWSRASGLGSILAALHPVLASAGSSPSGPGHLAAILVLASGSGSI